MLLFFLGAPPDYFHYISTINWYFTDLPLSLQVKLELIRQAESLEQVKEILEEGVSEIGSSPANTSWVHTATKEHRPRENLTSGTNKGQLTIATGNTIVTNGIITAGAISTCNTRWILPTRHWFLYALWCQWLSVAEQVLMNNGCFGYWKHFFPLHPVTCSFPC